MSTRASIEARLVRRRRAVLTALAATAATTVVTGCAHSLGGGLAPEPLLLATAFVATLLVLAPVLGARGTRARGGTPRQLVAIALAQMLQHVVYSSPESASSASSAGAHVHDAGLALQSAAIGHAHASMPLAHVAAGAVTLALLRCVPRLVDDLLATARSAAVAAFAAPVVAAVLAALSPRFAATVLAGTRVPGRARASALAAGPAPRRPLEVLLAVVGTRGPPRSFA